MSCEVSRDCSPSAVDILTITVRRRRSSIVRPQESCAGASVVGREIDGIADEGVHAGALLPAKLWISDDHQE